MKTTTYYAGILGLLLLAACKREVPPSPAVTEATSEICYLEGKQTDYQLKPYVRILKDTISGYTISDILQPSMQEQFVAHTDYSTRLENQQYYWGKLQIENRLSEASQYTEWVLYFNETWTSLQVYVEQEDGSWRQEQNGTFTPDRLKRFAPTASGNLVRLPLPAYTTVTVYFRGASEQTDIHPSFYIHLKHIETFYDSLLKLKVGNAIFMGFLLMMFLYNLIIYFFGRDRSFIFYSAYLIMLMIYTAYVSDDLIDWFNLLSLQPAYRDFFRLPLYLAMMCYLAFIRSFLELKNLLPKWDTAFKAVIYLGFPLILIDIIVLLLTNFSFEVADQITVPYIILVVLLCCALLYPLFKTRDKKGYFIIAGITAISLGAMLTVISRLWMPPFSLFYLKAGTIIEILIFSLGLAYRQQQQKQARQEADFRLKESRLIQEKKQLEAARLKELNEFKARFYTNITHEFRTPLTVIMGISENIRKHEEEKKLIQRNSQNLLRLINQLLDLSKLESGTLTLNKVHQNIIKYLQYLTESFYSNATQKDIRLVFHSEEEVLMMDYDEEKIQQIVYNLLSNALKFTGPGGKIIFLAGKVEVEGQPFLQLKVKDTGIGIPKEEIAYIFDRFYQVHATEHHPEGNSGIGLALTKELVELMNGQIEVKSQVGKGTTFTVYLPIEARAQPGTETGNDRKESAPEKRALQTAAVPAQAGLPSEIPEDEEAPGTDALPYLLIIEDNADIITYIKSILKLNYKIHTARNGALGIEKAREIIPDIIISDVMMPEKNGYEVCDTLKQDERTSHIPIVLLTAKTTQADKVDGLKYGADAYLTKPFDKEELIVRLDKLVEMRQRLQERYARGTEASLTTEPSLDDLFLQKLRGYLQAELGNAGFGVSQLASAASMSQMQLYRKLKALTSKTPSQFIRSYRLQKALELLRKGELNISEIAYDVGFADPSYFSRVFHKEYGKSPSYFIKT